MTRKATPKSDLAQAAAMDVVAVATIGYWIEYFTTGTVKSSDDPAYLAFENSFPLADGYMAATFLVAARKLRRQERGAVPWGIAAGSAMVFLGAMDTLYNLENRKYAEGTAEMAVETLINVVCLTFGPYTMWRSWRSLARLGG